MIATTGETVVNMFTQRYGKREPDTTNTQQEEEVLVTKTPRGQKRTPKQPRNNSKSTRQDSFGDVFVERDGAVV